MKTIYKHNIHKKQKQKQKMNKSKPHMATIFPDHKI